MASTACGCDFVDTPFLAGACSSANFAFFMGLVELVLQRTCNIADPCRRPSIATRENIATHYDFIVVGAGVAGPVMAGRLSENPNWKVLLLEAGPPEPTVTQVPSFSISAVGSALDWKYVTENSSQACLSTGGRCKWPRGKMVSGTSGMQGLFYTRAHRAIFDAWNKTSPGWSFEDVLPYFKKSERNLNPDMVDPGYHGFDGPMPVQVYPEHPEMSNAVLQAGEQLGYRIGDVNGANQTGVANLQMMLYEGMRMSTSRAYLRPFARARHNLRVQTNSQVTKIIIHRKTKKAFGVQYVDSNNQTHTVYARKEVILTAGAVASPQLLLLSGVGPRQHLQEVGIDVVVDLPGVGQNLQNHVASAINFFADGEDTTPLTYDALMEYVQYRNGSLANTGLKQTNVFMTTKYAKDGIPDMQIFFSGFWGQCSATGKEGECVGTGQVGNCGRRKLIARPVNVMTESSGYLKLRSNNPLDYPLIYPRYLTVQKDMDVLVEGLKLSIALAYTPAMKKYNVTVDTTKVKGCEEYEFATDEYFRCIIRMETGPENHQAGSCKMGPKEDPMAVVDNQLRVHGVPNIRVVDPSFYPVNANGSPGAVIIMAAEKASDMIKQAWEGKKC